MLLGEPCHFLPCHLDLAAAHIAVEVVSRRGSCFVIIRHGRGSRGEELPRGPEHEIKKGGSGREAAHLVHDSMQGEQVVPPLGVGARLGSLPQRVAWREHGDEGPLWIVEQSVH